MRDVEVVSTDRGLPSAVRDWGRSATGKTSHRVLVIGKRRGFWGWGGVALASPTKIAGPSAGSVSVAGYY